MTVLIEPLTNVKIVPFVTVLDFTPSTSSKNDVHIRAPRQARTKNCKDNGSLRRCLNEKNESRLLDMQRCSDWMFPVISAKFDVNVEVLKWAHSFSPISDNVAIDGRLQSIVRTDMKTNSTMCFIGLDLLKVFDGYVDKPNTKSELFRLYASGQRRIRYTCKRRFSFCVKIKKSLRADLAYDTLVFVTDHPAIEDFPLLAYNIWDPAATPGSLLEDVFSIFIADLEEVLVSAEWHMEFMEQEIMKDPTNSLYASRILSDKNTWMLLLSQTKSMLNSITRLNEATKCFDNSTWLPVAKDELEVIRERIQVGLINRTSDLTSLMINMAALEEARAAVHQGESIRRLTWLTFIFLPLSFMAAIFGMNVDEFANNPRIKWFFVASAVTLTLVILALVGIKVFIRTKRSRNAGLYSSIPMDEV